MREHFFMCLLTICTSSLQNCPDCVTVFWLNCFSLQLYRSLYILDITLLDVLCTNIFSHSMTVHFNDSFFNCAEVFQFNIVPFVYFCFPFRAKSTKTSLRQIWKILMPMFSSILWLNSYNQVFNSFWINCSWNEMMV